MSKELALKIAEGMPEFVWAEGCIHESGVTEAQAIEFATRYHAEMMEKYGKNYYEWILDPEHISTIPAAYQAGAASREPELQGLRETLNVISELCDTLREENERLKADSERNSLSKLDRECLRIGQEIHRAANEIPELWGLELRLEKDAAYVALFRPGCTSESFNNHCDGLSHSIRQAIDAARKEG